MDERLYNVFDERGATIIEWRATCFVHAGMTQLDANILAIRRDVDRVEVEALLARGASSAQARDIVT